MEAIVSDQPTYLSSSFITEDILEQSLCWQKSMEFCNQMIHGEKMRSTNLKHNWAYNKPACTSVNNCGINYPTSIYGQLHEIDGLPPNIKHNSEVLLQEIHR